MAGTSGREVAALPRPYSADPCEWVLLAGEAGMPPAVVAERLASVSRRFIRGARGRARRAGAAPSRMAARAGIEAAGAVISRALVAERDDRTLAEYAAQLAARAGRARGSALCGHWRGLTVLGALSSEGMAACHERAFRATTTRVFLAFPRAVLVPEPRRRHPNATVLMDNLSAPNPKAVETVLTKAGFKLLYPPRHSPDLSPIEPGWSTAKSASRAAEAGTPEALEAALAPARDSIALADARGWFNLCGYPLPN
jgi:transposase